MSIYVAHPIDQLGHGTSWFGQTAADLETALKTCGFDSYWPAHSWSFAAGGAKMLDTTKRHINAVNLVALEQSEAMVVLLPANVPSLGVPVEIEHALAWNKPTVIVTEFGPMQSVQMFDWSEQGAHVTSSVREGLSWLVSLMAHRGTLEGAQGQGTATETATEANETDGRDGDDGEKEADAGPVLRFRAYRRSGGKPPLPHRQYPGDAGFDLYSSEAVTVQPGAFVDIDCGYSLELPDGWWGWITGRSSTLRDRGLLVSGAVIDNGYRGPLFLGVQNLSNQTAVNVKVGERLGQLIPLPLFPGVALEVDELSVSARDQRGFGSSGR